MALPTKAKITALVCNGLKRPKLNQEIPSVKFGNKNINASSKPTKHSYNSPKHCCIEEIFNDFVIVIKLLYFHNN